jgi:hypothetical protein
MADNTTNTDNGGGDAAEDDESQPTTITWGVIYYTAAVSIVQGLVFYLFACTYRRPFCLERLAMSYHFLFVMMLHRSTR